MVTQDGRLFLLGDDTGNDAFTANIRATMLWKGYETDFGNLEIRIGFEYADLWDEKYVRYSGGAGYSFNYMPIPFTNYTYSLSPFINIGVINRGSNSATPVGLELGFDLKFPINEWLKLATTVQWTDRSDINKPLPKLKLLKDYSFGVGAEVVIF